MHLMIELDPDLVFCVRNTCLQHKDCSQKDANVEPSFAENVSAVLTIKSDTFHSVNLSQIFRFILATKEKLLKGKAAIICSQLDMTAISDTTVLAGSFLILSRELKASDLLNQFSPIANFLRAYDDITLADFWNAIYRAKRLGWLNLEALEESWEPPNQDNALPVLDILEYLHYDNPANGCFHFVVPGKLLLFHQPEYAGESSMWRDAGGARAFSAEYYADLFMHLGVSLVLRVGDCGAGDAASAASVVAAFDARGIAVEDLPLDGGAAGDGLLRGIDRFIALLLRAPGAVAVHGGPAGLGRAAALIAAYLISKHGFEAEAAVAWLRLAHPPLAAAAAG